MDAGAGKIDVGSPLTLHPAVLRGPGVHYWWLAVGGTTFSLGHILVRPCIAAGLCLRLRPLIWKKRGVGWGQQCKTMYVTP